MREVKLEIAPRDALGQSLKDLIWTAFGYTAAESRKLEGIVDELVRTGAAGRHEDARRAIAAVTWQPTYREKGALASLRFQKRVRRALRSAIAP